MWEFIFNIDLFKLIVQYRRYKKIIFDLKMSVVRLGNQLESYNALKAKETYVVAVQG